MKREEKINNEIEKTLKQFENSEVLDPNPYLYTRIQQTIIDRKKPKNYFGTFLKPALFSILFVFNIITMFWYMNSTEDYLVDDSNQCLVEILSSDFNLDNDQSDILIVE